MRSKASSSIAIFFICVPTYKKNMGNANFYCHVEKNRTGTAEMPSGQRSSIQTMHTLALMVNHAGLFLSSTFPLACFWREIGTYLDIEPIAVLLHISGRYVLYCQHRSIAHQLVVTLAKMLQSSRIAATEPDGAKEQLGWANLRLVLEKVRAAVDLLWLVSVCHDSTRMLPLMHTHIISLKTPPERDVRSKIFS